MASGTSFAGFRPFYSLAIQDLPSFDLPASSHQPARAEGVTTASNGPFPPTTMRHRSRGGVQRLPLETEPCSSSEQESESSREESAIDASALYGCLSSLAQEIARIPPLFRALAGQGIAFVVESMKSAVNASCWQWLAIKRWWLPLRHTPSPDPINLALISTRRRRRLQNEPIDTTAGSQIAVSGRQPLSVRRPKSLQHARQWRDMGKPTSLPIPRCPRVGIHVKTLRNAFRGEGYTIFRRHFKYDAPPDSEAQLALADVYDNPVLTAVTQDGEFDNTDLTERAGRKIVKAPPAQQPPFVVHPLYWEGELGEHPSEAIKQSMNLLVTVLTIDHCYIVLNDVVAILALSQTLQSLEVRNVVADGQSVTIFTQSEGKNEAKSLSRLTLTSCVPVDPVLKRVAFPELKSISLRLCESANTTTFDDLQGETAPSLRTFTLRGRLEEKEKLEKLANRLKEQGSIPSVICSPPQLQHNTDVIPTGV
ncbi:hypothetical protein NMY22_g5387 [Coprinellus aureogranulatus]|nr:hypothetical protein NMY22_g5387 [Coprinellus aureogranulatus]